MTSPTPTPIEAPAAGRFRPVRSLSPEQAGQVRGLHDDFTRTLGAALSAHLRCPVEVRLHAIEQPNFAEFAEALPAIGYIVSLGIAPLGVNAALQLDLALAKAMIEGLLGGGGSAGELQDVTLVEEQLLEAVVALIAAELQKAWEASTRFTFEVEGRQPFKYIHRMMSPHERLLVLVFEIELEHIAGSMTLAVPAVAANTLLRKLGEAWVYPRRAQGPDLRPRLKERLGSAAFEIELLLPPAPVAIGRILELAEGQVLPLRHAADTPARVCVSGRALFQAQPVRQGSRRGALLKSTCLPAPVEARLRPAE